MSPKLKSLLARVILVGGVALVASLVARGAPHEQTLAIRLGSRAVRHLEAVVTRQGDDEPTAGFSQEFPGTSPHMLRHTFSAQNGTYIVVITLREHDEDAQTRANTSTSQQGGAGAPPTNQDRAPPTNQDRAPPTNQHRDAAPAAGDPNPNLTETTFERRVSLVGGELIVSPD